MSSWNWHQAQLLAGLQRALEHSEADRELVRTWLPECWVALKDVAFGYSREVEYHTKRGETRTRTYEMPPNVEALRLVLQIAGSDPKLLADLLLAVGRAQTAFTQPEMLSAQTSKARRETLLIDQLSVSPAFVRECLQGLFVAGLSVLQSTPPDQFPHSQEEKDRYCARFRRIYLERMQDYLETLNQQDVPVEFVRRTITEPEGVSPVGEPEPAGMEPDEGEESEEE